MLDVMEDCAYAVFGIRSMDGGCWVSGGCLLRAAAKGNTASLFKMRFKGHSSTCRPTTNSPYLLLTRENYFSPGRLRSPRIDLLQGHTTTTIGTIAGQETEKETYRTIYKRRSEAFKRLDIRQTRKRQIFGTTVRKFSVTTLPPVASMAYLHFVWYN